MPGWRLTTVISGGQTGADQGGICAAKFLNYDTGGMAPKGFETEEGPAPWLAHFGLREGSSKSHKSRTYHNVVHADATVIFTGMAMDPKAIEKAKGAAFGATVVPSPDKLFAMYGVDGGSLYTAKLAIAHRKFLMINPTKDPELRQWIYEGGIKTLNVAGNRESKAPGIYEWVYEYLLDALVPF